MSAGSAAAPEGIRPADDDVTGRPINNPTDGRRGGDRGVRVVETAAENDFVTTTYMQKWNELGNSSAYLRLAIAMCLPRFMFWKLMTDSKLYGEYFSRIFYAKRTKQPFFFHSVTNMMLR